MSASFLLTLFSCLLGMHIIATVLTPLPTLLYCSHSSISYSRRYWLLRFNERIDPFYFTLVSYNLIVMCVRITLSQCLAAKGTDEVSRWNGALGARCVSSLDDLWLPCPWAPSPLQLRSPPWTPGASPVGVPCHVVVPPGSHGCPVVVSWQIQKREQTRLIPYPVKSYFTTLRESIS